MIESLLIANRGEIACRIIRTARAMGIRTIAVYSAADAAALHVRQADQAVAIGPAPARDSYLVGERIIQAALTARAQAIHPGYGFLSENADFAQAVIDAGLVWVGPKPESIRAMGLKDAAKARMMAAGVPVTPGYLGEDQSDSRLRAAADAVGYPVLIKAVAGGGGKGMRRVNAGGDFAEALQSCRREAAAGFGDDRVLIEKLIESPRHIEVQVFGDAHGNVVHLFERDCSLQRRHQKVIEEAPAPGMDDATRAAVCAAAVRAARAVDYQGAGTVEFIADASEGLRADRIWFMEMNTRLQVEHPVTEAITGQDLVEWQLRVASGEPLPLRQDQLTITGWGIEARLYAEDPARGFLPSTGRIDDFHFPPDLARVDSGVIAGGVVSPFYDPMLAKLIVHGPTRAATIAGLRAALAQGAVGPLVTNSGFLWRLLGHADFARGAVDTGLIERDLDRLADPCEPSAAGLAQAAARLIGGAGDTPWTSRSGLRLNAAPQRAIRLNDQFGRTFMTGLDTAGSLPADTPALPVATLDEGGERLRLRLARSDGAGGGQAGDGTIVAPMPGRVIAVHGQVGHKVRKGDPLLVLEAMKMEHTLIAPFAGTLAELAVSTGAQVQVEALLARVEAD